MVPPNNYEDLDTIDIIDCPHCNGSGYEEGNYTGLVCYTCGGDGTIRKLEITEESKESKDSKEPKM